MKKTYHIGVVEYKLSNLSDDIQKLDDGRFFKRTAIPCGRGIVVNITVFGEVKHLRRLKSNDVAKVHAVITEKRIINSSIRKFYNLDFDLVHPNSKIEAKVKIAQKVSKDETGRVFDCPQGGSIVVSRF